MCLHCNRCIHISFILLRSLVDSDLSVQMHCIISISQRFCFCNVMLLNKISNLVRKSNCIKHDVDMHCSLHMYIIHVIRLVLSKDEFAMTLMKRSKYNAVFHQGVHYLRRQKRSSEKEIHFLVWTYNLWPLGTYNWSCQVCYIKPTRKKIPSVHIKNVKNVHLVVFDSSIIFWNIHWNTNVVGPSWESLQS